jgi:hypothetical protein
MALLLSYAQQQAIKPISANNASKYDQLAAEVESLEIDKLLGAAFYQSIVADPTNEDYLHILDSYEFTRADDTLITHRGLRYVIAYLNYAKYIGESYVVDSFTGFVQKIRPDSERISSGDIKRLQQENREIAFNAFELIQEFIELNEDIYTLWNSASGKKISKPNFYGVKKTIL